MNHFLPTATTSDEKERDAKCAILPVGSFEQHGEYLPLITDTVIATVVSAPAADRAVLDCGSKTLSSDPLRPRPGGHGWILERSSRLASLSEEHGVVLVESGETFHVGERVRVLPNHACVVSNLHDRIVLVRGDRVEGEWNVAARGRVR